MNEQAMRDAADVILAKVTAVAGRLLYDAPGVDVVPLLHAAGVSITAGEFRALYNATIRDNEGKIT